MPRRSRDTGWDDILDGGQIGIRWDQRGDRDRERVCGQGLGGVAFLDLHRERRHREAATRGDCQDILALPLLRLWRQAQRAGGAMLHDLKRPQCLGHVWQRNTHLWWRCNGQGEF